MKPKFFSYSFGCRVNQAEKETLDRELIQLGYEFNQTEPDFYVINTCSVTHKAEREARQLIYQIKKELPETKLIVTGCAATNWIKTRKEVAGADLLVDNQNKAYLATIISKRLGISNSKDDTISNQRFLKANDLYPKKDKYTDSKRIILRIQDGCQRFCTYCIVPYLRGLPKSTPINDIIKKINSLKDIQEVILAAINTEAYGYDTKERFLDLVKAVLNQTSVKRLSFGSIHPWSINDEFIEYYKSIYNQKRFINFFHIPLQSGSNKMLQLMKRGYTREEFVEKLNTIMSINPFAFIGTDVIVGFLEENDQDFEDTYSFLESTPISKFHVFRYSQREHTAAYYLGKRLKEPDPLTKEKRSKALLALNKQKYANFLLKHLGKTFEALILEKRENELQQGLLENQIPVKIKTIKNRVGEIQKVRIIDCKNDQLFGRIV